MKEKLMQEFQRIFGGTDDVRLFFAPGRVNMIGEHTDYNGGHVFPCALTIGTYAAARRNGMDTCRFYSMNFEHLGIIAADLEELEYDKEANDWANYPMGIIAKLREAGINIDEGMDFVFCGNIPNSSGLSSSASIEVLTAFACRELFGFEMDFVEMSKLAQKAENEFIGVNCGIMDQFASAMGKKDNAILLNCGTLEYKYVPLNLGDYVLVLANTCKKHSLGSSKYNERRGEVDKGLEILKAACPKEVENLCDYTEEDFNQYGNAITDPVIYNRVKHVILENERVKKAVAILEAGDLEAFGKILCEANDSIRYLYEVTGDELDAMWEEARKIPGCLGSRMTGAGFGGCVLNIVKKDVVDEFVTTVGKNYEARTGIKPEFYICQIGDGAREV